MGDQRTVSIEWMPNIKQTDNRWSLDSNWEETTAFIG